MTWNSPPGLDEKHGTFVAYKVKCWSGEDLAATYNLLNVTHVIVAECRPYETYICCVSLLTTVATSMLACQEQTTLEEGEFNTCILLAITFNGVFLSAPESPPANVTLDNGNAYSVLVHWSPPMIPNGIITHYTLYVCYGNGTAAANISLDGEATSHNITSLHPYQQITVKVTASTQIGEGPSSTSSIRTAQAGIILCTALELLCGLLNFY